MPRAPPSSSTSSGLQENRSSWLAIELDAHVDLSQPFYAALWIGALLVAADAIRSRPSFERFPPVAKA